MFIRKDCFPAFMKDTEYSILSLFKKHPSGECSTSEIVRHVEPVHASRADELINNVFNDRKKTAEGKKLLAQLHRKVLYYINKLIEEEILMVSAIGSKGEKRLRLSIDAGEEILIQKNKRKIIITRPPQPATPIEGYEQKNIVFKYEEPTWISRVNSLLLETRQFSDITALANQIVLSFNHVNDAIGLANFEHILNSHRPNVVASFLQNISGECQDYGRDLTCIIDIDNLTEPADALKVMGCLRKLPKDRLHLVFEMRNSTLERATGFFKPLVELFAEAKVCLNLKNNEVFKPPYILGRAGPYTFDEHEWKVYDKEFRQHTLHVICGQSAIAVDTESYARDNRNPNEFRTLVLKIARSLLTSNTHQRSRSHEYLGGILKGQPEGSKEFMTFSRNYIRFWNYGWKDEHTDPTLPVELLMSAKEEVQRFCASEYTIYQSCGMPTRFDVAFAPAFKDCAPRLSAEKFQRLVITRPTDLYDERLRRTLRAKEKLFRIFDGGDRVRFFHKGLLDSEEILQEFSMILSSYKFPLLSFDFGEPKGLDVKLTSFLR